MGPPRLAARLYAWACQRIYYEFAWGYDVVSWVVSFGRWSRWRRFAIDSVATKDALIGDRVLEIGFGTGDLLAEWATGQRIDVPQNIYGLELSAPMQRVTAAKLRRRQLNVPRVLGSGEELPFGSGTFQSIIATFPAADIFSPRTLNECARVLEQNRGTIIIVGAWVSLYVPLLQALHLPFYGEPDKSVVAEIVERMEHAGFRVALKSRRDGLFGVSVIEGTVVRC